MPVALTQIRLATVTRKSEYFCQFAFTFWRQSAVDYYPSQKHACQICHTIPLSPSLLKKNPLTPDWHLYFTHLQHISSSSFGMRHFCDLLTKINSALPWKISKPKSTRPSKKSNPRSEPIAIERSHQLCSSKPKIPSNERLYQRQDQQFDNTRGRHRLN